MKVQVEIPGTSLGRQTLTYAALDDLGIEVGDTVLIASGQYANYHAIVTAIGSDYEGYMHTISAVVAKAPQPGRVLTIDARTARDLRAALPHLLTTRHGLSHQECDAVRRLVRRLDAAEVDC